MDAQRMESQLHLIGNYVPLTACRLDLTESVSEGFSTYPWQKITHSTEFITLLAILIMGYRKLNSGLILSSLKFVNECSWNFYGIPPKQTLASSKEQLEIIPFYSHIYNKFLSNTLS